MADQWNDLMDALREEKYEITRPKGGHYAIWKDGKRVGTLPSSASEYRGWPNALSKLRREINFEYLPKKARKEKKRRDNQ